MSKTNISPLMQKYIDCMIVNFGGKWLNCAVYEKCLRKFHISTIQFEDHVNVEFKHGYIRLIEQKEMGRPVWDGKPMYWHDGNKQIGTGKWYY